MKKAQIGGEMIYFLLYLVVTFAIIFGIQLLPSIILSSNLETHNLENQIYTERIFNAASDLDIYTKRVLRGKINQLNDDLLSDVFSENKIIGFEVNIGGDKIYFNQDFYEYASQLAPIRYDLFTQKRYVNYKGPKALEVRQVYDNKK
ncbi:hypothetical protein HY837_00425 [archaeon]|nr:hypothetical protein [archaeon]